ncbi:hypothetical protein M3Y99_01798100 [Aphelenchoides fujianensis]|nr:hypothetical protein M3Y99_01798100 [Aphelenchoides fujianensis]
MEMLKKLVDHPKTSQLNALRYEVVANSLEPPVDKLDAHGISPAASPPSKATTRLPVDLERDVMSNLRALGISNSNALSQAHIAIAEQPMEVNGHHFDAPTVQYADRKSQLDSMEGSWGTGKYFRPASIKKWALYSFRRAGDRGGNNMPFADMNTFHNAFVRFCRSKGMTIGNANDGKEFVIPDTKEMEHQKIMELMNNAAGGGCQFVLYVTGKEDVS